MGNKKINVAALNLENESLKKIDEEAYISAIEKKYNISRTKHPNTLRFLDEYKRFRANYGTHTSDEVKKHLTDADLVIKELIADPALTSLPLFLEIMQTCLFIYNKSSIDRTALLLFTDQEKLSSFLNEAFQLKNKLRNNYLDLCLQYVKRGLAQEYPNQLVKLFHEMVGHRPVEGLNNKYINDDRRKNIPIINSDELAPKKPLIFETNQFEIPSNEKLLSKLSFLVAYAKYSLEGLRSYSASEDHQESTREEIIKHVMEYHPDPKKSIDALMGFFRKHPINPNDLKDTIGSEYSDLTPEDIDSIPQILFELIELTYGPEISGPPKEMESRNQKLLRLQYERAAIREDESRKPSWKRQHANPARDTWTTLATLSK